jgi:hypothetical protein
MRANRPKWCNDTQYNDTQRNSNHIAKHNNIQNNGIVSFMPRVMYAECRK